MPRILDSCPGCGRTQIAHGGKGLCRRCYTRKRREDPVQRERDRESSRRWKQKHRYHDLRPHYSKRIPTDRPRSTSYVYPFVAAFCRNCDDQLLDPDPLCGFCLIELPPYDKLRLMELFPGQDEQWHEYFSLLTNNELEELIKQAQLEKAARLSEHLRRFVAPMMTDRYRRDGNGNVVGVPAHHRRCPVCNKLAVNCKGHADVTAA